MNYEAFQKVILASCVSLALASGQAAAVTIGADVELDTDAVDAGDDVTYTQGGRVAVNATGKKELDGGVYVEGKGTLLAKKDGSTATDDMWVKFGASAWSLQAGRFEAINLFPLGKDTLLLTAGDGSAQTYHANLGRGRAGDDAGQLALVVSAGDSVSLELDTIWGSTDGDDKDTLSVIRPSVTYSSNLLTLTAGMEMASYDTDGGEVDKTGFGVTGNFNLGGASINLNVASLDDDVANTTVQSIGANLTYGNFGIGAVQSTTDLAAGDDPEVSSVYVAYSMPILGIDGATVTLAASSSSADNAGDNDSASGVRARINYTF